MEMTPYLVVTAESPDDLQEQCSAVMKQEELDGEVMYVYEPLGAPLIERNMYGFPTFIQVFTAQMLMPMGEIPEQRLDS